jgi:hypothetical protein
LPQRPCRSQPRPRLTLAASGDVLGTAPAYVAVPIAATGRRGSAPSALLPPRFDLIPTTSFARPRHLRRVRPCLTSGRC